MKIIRWLLSHTILILLIIAVIYGYMFWGNLAGEDTPAGKALAYLSNEFVEVEEFIASVKEKQAERNQDDSMASASEAEQQADIGSDTGGDAGEDVASVVAAEEDQAATTGIANTTLASTAADSTNGSELQQQPVNISYSHNDRPVTQNSSAISEAGSMQQGKASAAAATALTSATSESSMKSNAGQSKAVQSNAEMSNAEQGKASAAVATALTSATSETSMKSNAGQSKAVQSNAEMSNAEQGKASAAAATALTSAASETSMKNNAGQSNAEMSNAEQGNAASGRAPGPEKTQSAQLPPKKARQASGTFVSAELEKQLNKVDENGVPVKASLAESEVRESWILARKSFYLRNYKLSEKSYRNVIENTDDNYDAYGELGNVYFNQGKRREAAAAYYEAAAILVRKGQVNRAKSLLGLLRNLDKTKADELKKLIDSSLS